MFNFLRKTVWFKLIFFPDYTGPCYYSVLACTQALFYFSFRSFLNTGERARESARKKTHSQKRRKNTLAKLICVIGLKVHLV